VNGPAVEWRPVIGYEGSYIVSSLGEIRAIERSVTRSDGVTRKFADSSVGTKKMRSGHLRVYLWSGGVRRALPVHRIVAKSFLPNPDFYPLVRHLDDNPADNRVQNLAWGTYSQNQQDSVRNGRHFQASQTHCKHGHEFTAENTYIRSNGSRRCRRCAAIATKQRIARWRARQVA